MSESCCKTGNGCDTQMNPDKIKETVREHYGAAVEAQTGCCAKLDTATVGGARTSFGCGDPLALLWLALPS